MPGERAGGGDHGRRIGLAVIAPIKQRERQRRRLRGIEIGREAGEGDRVELLGDGCVVGHDQAGCGTAQALVGAHRHQMSALLKRVRPSAAGDQAAEMGGIEQDQGAHLVGDLAHLVDRMRGQVQAAADRDQGRAQLLGLRPQAGELDGVVAGVDREGVDLEPVASGAAGGVVGDMPADRRRRHDHPVARPGRQHERVEIGERARGDADLGVPGAEDLGRQLGGDHLDPLDALEAHLVLAAGIAERRA